MGLTLQASRNELGSKRLRAGASCVLALEPGDTAISLVADNAAHDFVGLFVEKADSARPEGGGSIFCWVRVTRGPNYSGDVTRGSPPCDRRVQRRLRGHRWLSGTAVPGAAVKGLAAGVSLRREAPAASRRGETAYPPSAPIAGSKPCRLRRRISRTLAKCLLRSAVSRVKPKCSRSSRSRISASSSTLPPDP